MEPKHRVNSGHRGNCAKVWKGRMVICTKRVERPTGPKDKRTTTGLPKGSLPSGRIKLEKSDKTW